MPQDVLLKRESRNFPPFPWVQKESGRFGKIFLSVLDWGIVVPVAIGVGWGLTLIYR
jgi:hypothetical protein